MVGWGFPPSEFWEMSPQEFWAIADAKRRRDPVDKSGLTADDIDDLKGMLERA